VIYNQDCIQGMKEHIQTGSVDLIFTDPPYGIQGDKLDAHYNRDESNVVPGYVEVPLETYDTFSKDWITECARCLRPGGSMYTVSGYTNLHHVLNALHSTDLIEVNHLVAKYSFGVYTKHKWVSSHYHVLFWQKPGARTFNQRYTDTKQSYHDRQSVMDLPRPGDVVMDPFCGGFSTQRSALRLGRQFCGFELNKNAVAAFSVDPDC
jgi:site-specific DNA-methyltransferase (adenine-specific)